MMPSSNSDAANITIGENAAEMIRNQTPLPLVDLPDEPG